MRCELRRLHSPDVRDLECFRPEDQTYFGLLIQAMIGPEGGPGEEAFDFILCSPTWLRDHLGNDGARWCHGILVTQQYDYTTLYQAVQKLCRQTDGESWDEIANRLGHFTNWEFDSYRPKPT